MCGNNAKQAVSACGLPVKTYCQALCYLAAGPVDIPDGKDTRECTNLSLSLELRGIRCTEKPPKHLSKIYLKGRTKIDE